MTINVSTNNDITKTNLSLPESFHSDLMALLTSTTDFATIETAMVANVKKLGLGGLRAYIVQLAPLLFADEDPQPGVTPVASPVCSQGAMKKQRKRGAKEGLPVSSFEDLLLHLNGLCIAEMDLGNDCTVPITSKPTALQTKVFDLLGGKIHPAPGEAKSV